MKVIVVGAAGVMGQHVINALAKKNYECSALVDIKYKDERKANEYASLKDVNADADVIIDFSFHDLTKNITDFAKKRHIPLVIATTGQTDDEKELIKKVSEEVAIFYSGNMSLGIASLSNAIKVVLSMFPDADVEIVETHHNRKADAPSGTAKMLFEAVKDVRPDAYANCGRNGLSKRTKDEVGISSIRVGNVVGIHEVIIGTQNEQITLKHEAYDRSLFADGAIKAAEFIVGKKNGLYTMKEIFKN